jgi:hypothetical protein
MNYTPVGLRNFHARMGDMLTSMLKWKGGEWDHANTAHNLVTMCVSLHIHFSFSWRGRRSNFFFTTSRPTTLNTLRQYALQVLFVPSALASDCACATIPFVHKPRTLDHGPRPHRCVSGLGRLGKYRGSMRQVQHESMGRSTGTQSVVRRQNQLGH